jgi:DEAD/DEAH box helicase domain-containing protein
MVGFPELAVAADPDSTAKVGGVTLAVHGQTDIVRINDNLGRLFPLRSRPGDPSVIADDSSLYDDEVRLPGGLSVDHGAAAIGEVRKSDVLVITPDQLDLHGKVIPTRRSTQPAGLAALWSLAEVLRRGSQAELDVDPHELTVGLNPVRVGDEQTHRIFVADTLENGAGYATLLGQEDMFRGVLLKIVKDLRARWEAPEHADECTSSCPDCLRSYDNRRIHSALDWRLALDTAELAAGEPVDWDRWLARSKLLVRSFQAAFELHGVQARDCEGLWALTTPRKRGVLLGHPLWRRDRRFLREEQANALYVMEAEWGLDVQLGDLFELDRTPMGIARRLLQ